MPEMWEFRQEREGILPPKEGNQYLITAQRFPASAPEKKILWDPPSGTTWGFRDPLEVESGNSASHSSCGQGEPVFRGGKKCEPEGEKRRNQLLMDPLECFLPMVIPSLFRQHLPIDTLLIIIIFKIF